MLHQVLVTRTMPGDSIRRLKAYSKVEEVAMSEDATKADLISHLQGKNALLCTLTDVIDREVIAACPALKIISNFGVGYNHIDIQSAHEQGILVTYTPHVLTEATADLTWALLLDVARRVTEGDRLLRSRKWSGWTPTFLLGREVSGKTLGIIGMGRIGQAVARRASGFKMKVIYYSRTRLPHDVERELQVAYGELKYLLQEADFVSLHAPYTKETHHLIGAEQLRSMKATAYLINTARGTLVDEQALLRALQEGRIAGAGLDVYEREPSIPAELIQLEQVVLAPHLGSATWETRTAMAELAVDHLLAYFKGEKPTYTVSPF
jgi:glyoxylate reductase